MRTPISAAVVLVSLAAFNTSLYAQSSAPEIVLRASTASTVAGRWQLTDDPTAAGGQSIRHPDAGAAKITAPLATPPDYFELTFDAQASVPYHLWIRGKADGNHWANDSVYVQFTNSVTADGASAFQIGTASGAHITVEDCTGCGLRDWGWQDNGYGSGVLGPHIYFATSGVQRVRVQTREDGLAIDQVVLSPVQYFTTAPGGTKRDSTILDPSGGGGGTPAAALVRGPYLQRASATTMTVVWATLENGTAEVRYETGGTAAPPVPATTRRVTAATSGLGYDYYQHEASLETLISGTTYSYGLLLNGGPVGADATYSFKTAPATGSGRVRFAALGDSGTGSSQQHQIAGQIAAEPVDLMLHGGDIAYGNSGGTGDASYKTFHDWFFTVYKASLSSRPFFPAEGNHDSRPSNGDGRAYLDLFVLPENGASGGFPDHAERYYSFDYGPIHFVVLDTEFAFQDSTRRVEQLSWLEADLAATTQPWKIAVFHRPPFSAGGEHGSELAVRDTFVPIFERYGVQLALSAHEHDYERTHPWAIAGGSKVVYVVTGGGGAPLYPAAVAEWTAYSASRHHYVRGDVDSCTLLVEAVGLDGAVFDTTTLSRCEEPPPDPEPDPEPESPEEIVLYAADAATVSGGWSLVADSTAAGGFRLHHPNANAAKLSSALASPTHYFEMTFNAVAGVPYKLWLRARADANSWANDSAFIQFNGQVGTTASATFTLEDCTGCGVSAWGWQDEAFNAVAAPITFPTSGVQRLRIQTREDGLSIDQVVLSPAQFLSTPPGALKKDAVIVPR